MHKNLFWQAFLGIVTLVTLWYSCVAVYRYYEYGRLDGKVETSQITWVIEKYSDEAYTLKAEYQFVVNRTSYLGAFHFLSEKHLNLWAAERAVKSNASHSWTVWYDTSDPQHSSVQHRYPFKEIFSAIALWGLLLYFFWLGYYVARFKI